NVLLAERGCHARRNGAEEVRLRQARVHDEGGEQARVGAREVQRRGQQPRLYARSPRLPAALTSTATTITTTAVAVVVVTDATAGCGRSGTEEEKGQEGHDTNDEKDDKHAAQLRWVKVQIHGSSEVAKSARSM